MTPESYKLGREFLPFHPSASHVDPNYRDGWNDCYKAALKNKSDAEVVVEWVLTKLERRFFDGLRNGQVRAVDYDKMPQSVTAPTLHELAEKLREVKT